MSFDKPYPIPHSGVFAETGDIVVTFNRQTVVIPESLSLDERRGRIERMTLHLGDPWKPVPGTPEHKVVGALADGTKVTALMAGYAYNDAEMLDEVCGTGTYERVMPPENVEILKLARPLYQSVQVN